MPTWYWEKIKTMQRPNQRLNKSAKAKRRTAPPNAAGLYAPKRRLRLPWVKPKNPWFQSDHPTQRRSLKQSNWFPYAPEPEPAPPKPTFKLKLRYRPWMSSVSSVLLVLGIGGAVTGCGWLSMQFLMNPKSIVWVNSYLPKPLQLKIPGWDQPYPIADIKAQLKKAGLTMGEPMRLTDGSKAELLIPVFATDDACISSQNTCTKITELRVYRPATHPYPKVKSQHYQMVDQFLVAGMEDWYVQEPFVNAQVDVPPPSEFLLEFDTIERLDNNAPKSSSVWLSLKGERQQLGSYGQVLQYSPKTSTLTAMVPWSSPNSELPRWENVAAGGTPELVVDQTIGLETLYQIYSLQPNSRKPGKFDLQAIDLKKPALDDRDYQDALKLANTGLWSLALKRLETLGKSVFDDNPIAGLQRDVIAYHAKTFKEQAEAKSASTSQQVQSSLLDGRWEKAIAMIKAAPEDRDAVIDLLNADSGQLLRRLQVATELNPGNGALQAWNAAMKLARDGKKGALAWLKTQPANGDRNQFLTDLAPTLRPSPKPSPTASPTATPTVSPTANPTPKAEEKLPDWWKPVPSPTPIAPPSEPTTVPVSDPAAAVSEAVKAIPTPQP
jgi:hypothetical protein